MKPMDKLKQTDRSKIKLLQYLCQKQPELLICELAELIEASVETTFLWIKVYELPYHWKLCFQETRPRGILSG